MDITPTQHSPQKSVAYLHFDVPLKAHLQNLSERYDIPI